MNKIITFLFIATFFAKLGKAQTPYFPPISSTAVWDTLSPATLGWCTDKIDSLYNYLEQENSKGFIVLKDGKIVLEKYFDTFTKDSIWYWASAGKTITSFLIGKAQEDGLLSINDKSSTYLNPGWTSCTTIQEDSITIENQLTMTSGLDDNVPDNHCTLDTCLNYLSPVNTRWAYHNAPYTLLENVIENASGLTMNQYTTQKLKTQTGMNGLWFQPDFDNVYYSNVRSMARFGLLIQNNGVWNNDTLLHDNIYKTQMINTSQNLNLAYGYLWWLNGKGSFMAPTSQIVFPGSYAPDAPADMYAGIGKNGQIVSIAPSKGIVMIRMGESSSTLDVPFSLCTNIWKRLNAVMCTANNLENELTNNKEFEIYPNPSQNLLHIRLLSPENFTCKITDLVGHTLWIGKNETTINIATLPQGIYYIKLEQGGKYWIEKFIKE